MNKIYSTLFFLKDHRFSAICAFHKENEDLMLKARGSANNHQNWEGGYSDHICEIFEIAKNMFESLSKIRKVPFSLESALIVLYFHDIEKIWKYTTGEIIDKEKWYNEILPEKEICFTEEELNALKYVHGEHDYSGKERKMNRLAAFCHAVDCLSARMWFDEPKQILNE